MVTSFIFWRLILFEIKPKIFQDILMNLKHLNLYPLKLNSRAIGFNKTEINIISIAVNAYAKKLTAKLLCETF